MRYYNLYNYKRLPYIERLTAEEIHAIDVVARVFPFKVSEHTVSHLINWEKGCDDPMFRATFPHRDMLEPKDFQTIEQLLSQGASETAIAAAADEIRSRQNPDVSGQRALNVPTLHDSSLQGMQHKYRETLLVFPKEGQNCSTWCSFCFRWNQFVPGSCQRFSNVQPEEMLDYIKEHRDITDVLFTGGDPLMMRTGSLAKYILPLLSPEAAHIRNIRLGSRMLAWDPQRFISAPDSAALLELFRRIQGAERNLVLVAHWLHPSELQTPQTREACRILRQTGVQLSGQTPLLKGINDNADVLEELWREQTALGSIAYYMFIARDTGAHKYFEVPLIRAWKLYRDSVSRVSGLARSVRGPVMSCRPGKIIIDGPLTLGTESALALRYLQARKPELVGRPFLARFDDKATWWNDLKPYGASDEEFF
ncbi:lysine 2,3-aminomutase [bacterium]|nr:lysine 2,3-aminomutase [bacterium]